MKKTSMEQEDQFALQLKEETRDIAFMVLDFVPSTRPDWLILLREHGGSTNAWAQDIMQDVHTSRTHLSGVLVPDLCLNCAKSTSPFKKKDYRRMATGLFKKWNLRDALAKEKARTCSAEETLRRREREWLEVDEARQAEEEQRIAQMLPANVQSHLESVINSLRAQLRVFLKGMPEYLFVMRGLCVFNLSVLAIRPAIMGHSEEVFLF
ncbi:unnamed protein product [Dibothriocephalus latus]|uniref:Uncharacterized protein n=1 Tax=Dibothriocephalus latus TaxID=60516 RepID=A0A3P6TZW7_DIBLA|nr:unnamed protein product [Dibothriocephalus latus]